MPCSDGGQGFDEYAEGQRRRADRTEAMLCAVLSMLWKTQGEVKFKELIAQTNPTESGVSQWDIFHWWRNHIAKDEARKRNEGLKKELEQRKQEALKKLTPDERKLLNLK
jgi:hypothetical protein